MESEILKNWLRNLRVWLRALKLNMRGLWSRVFPRKTLEKQINALWEQNRILHRETQLLRKQRLELEADIRNINERLLKERKDNAEAAALVQKQNQLIAGNEILQTRCSELVERVRELEREREKWVEKTQCYRDVARENYQLLLHLDRLDPSLLRKPQQEYHTPTRKDLKNGPIPVEVSNDGQTWANYWLFHIGNHPNPYHCRFVNDENAESRFFYLARVKR